MRFLSSSLKGRQIRQPILANRTHCKKELPRQHQDVNTYSHFTVHTSWSVSLRLLLNLILGFEWEFEEPQNVQG
jgi:hypothetical protein